MERWVGRVALVTGASAGIGAAVSTKLVQAGMKVIGCARTTSKLEEIGSKLQNEAGSFEGIYCDLRKEDDILQMFENIKRKYGRVDVCVNSAGLSHHASMLTGETEQWRDMLEVNILALSVCTREAVKLMDFAGVDDGHVFHLNSLSGHRNPAKPGGGGMYAASKFAVRCLAECLRTELRARKSGIRITEISPGFVRTEFAGRTRQDMAAGEKFYQEHKEQLLEADDVADSLIHALAAPPNVQIHDILLRSTHQIL